MSKEEVLAQMKTLSAQDQIAVAQVLGLGPPPPQYVGTLWFVIVGAFAIAFVGGLAAIVGMGVHGTDPKNVVPIVTASLGVLAGLLAPSPVGKG
jgi:hypothetical protein